MCEQLSAGEITARSWNEKSLAKSPGNPAPLCFSNRINTIKPGSRLQSSASSVRRDFKVSVRGHYETSVRNVSNTSFAEGLHKLCNWGVQLSVTHSFDPDFADGENKSNADCHLSKTLKGAGSYLQGCIVNEPNKWWYLLSYTVTQQWVIAAHLHGGPSPPCEEDTQLLLAAGADADRFISGALELSPVKPH